MLNLMLLTMLAAVTVCYMIIPHVWSFQNSLQPIHGAAAKGHLSILQLLIDVYGVSPTARTEV